MLATENTGQGKTGLAPPRAVPIPAAAETNYHTLMSYDNTFTMGLFCPIWVALGQNQGMAELCSIASPRENPFPRLCQLQDTAWILGLLVPSCRSLLLLSTSCSNSVFLVSLSLLKTCVTTRGPSTLPKSAASLWIR